MNKKWLGSLMALGLMFSSCDKEASVEESSVIKFNGTISNLSATINLPSIPFVWMPTDQIGVFMVRNSTTTAVGAQGNSQYSYSGNQFTALANQDLFYPVDDSKVDFIAYHPYTPAASLSSSLNINVASQANQKNIDVLYAKSTNNSIGFNKTAGTNVPLVFDHKLSKIIINIIPGAGIDPLPVSFLNTNMTIIGLNTTTTIDLKTGMLGVASAPAPIIPFKNMSTFTFEAIVIPYSYVNAGDVKFNFMINGDTYVWNSAANETFEAGKEYTYNITINKTKVVLNSVTVNNWISIFRTGTAN